MNLAELQRNWDRFGNEDPLWAILTDPSKKGNKWDIDDFFKSGVEEIKGVMEYLEHLHLDVSRERALDFGCGVGRLTQALADYFKAVVGVDIAPSMINHARRFNRFGERCNYVVNQTDDLSIFKDETFSFVYSYIVLQHVEPKYALNYIGEFLRVLVPGGVVMFQLPSSWIDIDTEESSVSKITWRGTIRPFVPEIVVGSYRVLRRLLVRLNNTVPSAEDGPKMEMHVTPRQDVEQFVSNNGGRVLDVAQNQSAGSGWVSLQYLVTK